ncbi:MULTISPECIES: tripartite tricarboxylate transporter TctB family protein [unclassified Arthrobacter]|uniref:tripartite tricarboxylate transporter TctB family protein n=1 Tax=unclassified Arthrobacter TaxID=235627 RepID=UPI0009A5BD9B|nr:MULTISPECIES: tripartite tricarboxylate transporter TctB family protein [unclassified Arthrobacter]RDV08210.1 tripartite tricarboxylate transporter TctB family protein [Arthrobacter sp. RT-1]SLK11621.1 putative tricarboxylic transport membrane protein [Arthrobacter sp. P2b]
MSSSPTLASRLKGRAELGVALLLGAAGALVIWDAARISTPYSQSDPVGPKTLPFIVGAMLLVCAVLLAVNVLRGGQGEAEGGEDVDLTHPADWKTVLPLAGAFILNILLIDWAGWVISGTVLFWGSVLALGSRHYIRDGIISLALALLTFYGFYLGLGIALPAGLLEGIL